METRTNVTNSRNNESGAVSLRTIPVWLKSSNRKVKVNAILDDASNESFLNEDVAGMLGIQESFQSPCLKQQDRDIPVDARQCYNRKCRW